MSLTIDAVPLQREQHPLLPGPRHRPVRITLLRGAIYALYLVRRVPPGLLLLVIGLSFPVGPEVGPVVVTLADVALVWSAVQIGLEITMRNRRLWLPLIGGWATLMVGAWGSMTFSRDVGTSIIPLIEKLEMLLVFYLVCNQVRRQEQLTGMLIAFCLCGILNAGLGLAQFLGWTDIGLHGMAFVGVAVRTRAGAFVGGTLGAYLGSALVLLSSWLAISRDRWSWSLQGIHLTGIVVLTFGLVATLTRTWIFTTLVALFIIALYARWRAKFRMLSLALIALGLLTLAMWGGWFNIIGEGATEFVQRRLLGLAEQGYFRNLEDVRYAKWAEAWNDFGQAPVFGVGMGTVRFPNPFGTYGLVDNHYLETLAEMGIVGTLGFAWIVFGALFCNWKAVRLTRRTAHIGSTLGLFSSQILWLVGGLLWSLFDSGKPGMMFFMIVALAVTSHRVFVQEPTVARKREP